MGIEVINCPELAKATKKRTVVMNTRKMHAWVHYYPTPGDHDDMHCHNEDQTFYCIEGRCTMHFPDGGKAVLDPGTAALITGGSFYMLENSGDGPMIMMGNRSGNQSNIKHINYDTRKDLRAGSMDTGGNFETYRKAGKAARAR
jgi:mannose-6-phosphate isomerase-like protein (cupin superfamily)